MPVTVIADVPLKPERADYVLALIERLLPDTLAFPGCLDVEVLVDRDVPGHIVLLETWESQADHRRYSAWRLDSGTAFSSPEVMAGPIRVSYFDVR